MPFKKRSGYINYFPKLIRKKIFNLVSDGTPVKEVLIQGNQIAFAGKLLSETYKIPKKYIRGLELAVKQKKGK